MTQLIGAIQINVVASAESPDAQEGGDTFSPARSEKAPQTVHLGREIVGQQLEHTSSDELLQTYADWGSEVRKLLSCGEGVTKWNINVVYPHLPSDQWTKGKVAILGDAVSLGNSYDILA